MTLLYASSNLKGNAPMAKIFKPKAQSKSRKHKSKSKQMADFVGDVVNYDPKAKGIIKTEDGRIAFVSGAIKGERVKVRPITYTEKVIEAQTLDIVNSSDIRRTPACPVFNECGGCQLQYMPDSEQITAKQQALNGLMTKQLKQSELPWQPALSADEWHYRRTARLVTWFDKKGKVSLGFRQAKSKQIINIEQCPILVQPLSDLIQPLRQLLEQMTQPDVITHIQLFHLNNGSVVIFRTPKPLKKQDQALAIEFAEEHEIKLLVEADKQEFELLSGNTDNLGTLLEYQFENFNYQFSPNNFIQVNDQLNQLMISQALAWLNISEKDTVLDLFSGIGNFTLPMAKAAASVFAVEGVNDMVKKLSRNASLNDCDNVKAFQADLSKLSEKSKPQWLKPIDKLLLDPARDGAFEVVKKIPLLRPKKIPYVSCNPATMTRDLKVLLDANYELTKIGLLNMFPQTSHVEAMALLELK
jgi:23S rRNA (uracil1939-C5)-methyltransferase